MLPLAAVGAEDTSLLEELGDYERYAVEQVLDRREWRIADDPGSKLVDDIHVVSLPVFSERDGEMLQWFNRLHVTSKPGVIRHDILLESGDHWDPDEAQETERNLRDSTYPVFALAVVIPIETPKPDAIDVLVVTRDIWSLRPTASFEYQNGTLSDLFLAVSENNLLGRHKAPGLFFDMGLGTFGFGPRFFDPNVFGTHVQFFSRGRLLFDRGEGDFEGSRSVTQVAYPLWNLDRTWGADLTVSHRDEVVRQFRGPALLRYDNPSTAADESAPYKYRLRTFNASTRVRYATGETVEHRLSAGYRFQFQTAELTPDFPTDDQLREAFTRDALPPPERNSGPTLGYNLFVPEWRTYRNINSYELPEERRLGPYLNLKVAPALEFLGSLDNFVGMSATAGGRLDLFDEGFALAEGSVSSRLKDGDLVDTQLTGVAQVAPPPAVDRFRLVVRSRVDRLIDDTQNRLLFAGGRTGLRGYRIGAFEGQTRVLTNVEVRSMPVPVWTTRVGAVAFWDVGHATDRPGDLWFRHDVGLGLRVLIPQANTSPLRADWAFPLSADQSVWPGRLSVGFGQAF